MWGWLSMVRAAFLFILYIVSALGVIAGAAFALTHNHYLLFGAVVGIGGPLVLGTALYVADRSLR